MRLHPSLLAVAGSVLAVCLTGCDPGDRAASSGGSTPPANVTVTTNAPASSASPAANTPASAAANAPAGNAPNASAEGTKPASAKAGAPGGNKPVAVTMETSKGTIDLELYPDKAPISVKNFVSYARRGFYNGTIFHRVIPTFMIQGGGFTPGLVEKKTDPPIENESGNGLENKRGTLAMARTPDPNSATAQFFINVKDNDFLNKAQSQDGYGYAVFGKVVKGMDVVDKIKAVPTTTKNTPDHGPMGDVPADPVLIKSVRVK